MGTEVKHGDSAWLTKYKVVQHKASDADSNNCNQNFVEVLEIINPPSVRKSAIVHIFWEGHGFTYFEFDSVEHAIRAYQITQSLFVPGQMEKAIATVALQPGHSHGGHTTKRPWFYDT